MPRSSLGRGDDDILSLATVASLRQHPPVSPLSCCHRGSRLLSGRRAENSRFHAGARIIFGGCRGVMGGVRAITAAAVRVSRPERLKLDAEQLGHEDPLLLILITILILLIATDHHASCSRPPARSCAPLHLDRFGFFCFFFSFAPPGSHPAARAAEWIPPCSSSCCT